jgi:hypothetical protein
VRKLSGVAVGALAFAAAFLPSTAFAETTLPERQGDGVTSTESDISIGTFTYTPATGAPGTTVTVSSATSCRGEDGEVFPYAAVWLMDEKSFDIIADDDFDNDDTADLAGEQIIDLSESKTGDWESSVTIPADAENGVTYVIIAVCMASLDEDEDPGLVYEPGTFLVAKAPEAPVASPVDSNPTYTG